MGLDREIIIMVAAEDFSKVVMATRSIEAQPSALRISQFGGSGRTCTHQQAGSPSEFRGKARSS